MLAVALAGCTVAPYAPIVGAAATGQTRVSLADDPAYGALIGQTVIVPNDVRWSLQAFDKGRMFIQPERSESTRPVCSLAGQPLRIDAIFEDKVNGGVFFDATVTCPDGATHKAERSHWLNDLRDMVTA